MKSAYELAMERLNKQAPTFKLSAAQKEQIAELESKYKAKVAEREIGLKGAIDQAAEKMVQAAGMMAAQPIALQLRFLQTMREISSEHNTTTFLPVPIDLFSPFARRSADELGKK